MNATVEKKVLKHFDTKMVLLFYFVNKRNILFIKGKHLLWQHL